jgi:Arc/MetJ-type ribon-helix-helix transcriptional regulator
MIRNNPIEINVIENNHEYMARMESIQVRFPEEEIKRIDGYVERGLFHSRSDFIRDAVRKAELIRSLEEIRAILEKENLSEKDLFEGGKEVREMLFEKMFGDIS